MPWRYYREGNYNTAYINQHKTRILKIPKGPIEEPTERPERAVRVWNEINGILPFKAYIHQVNLAGKPVTGWVCPYIDGTEANDKDIHRLLIDIYNRTGRIVIDAMAHNNVVKTCDGRLICIDIGMALQLQMQEERQVDKPRAHIRRKSDTSLRFWAQAKPQMTPFFNTCYYQCLDTWSVNTVKALLLIQARWPDMTDVSSLKNNEEVLKAFAHVYDSGGFNGVSKAIKKRCIVHLKQYIFSRNNPTHDGSVQPTWDTRLFRNSRLTQYKTKAAFDLITHINNLGSMETLESALLAHLDNPILKQASISSGFETCLHTCLSIVQKAASQHQQRIERWYDATYTHPVSGVPLSRND